MERDLEVAVKATRGGPRTAFRRMARVVVGGPCTWVARVDGLLFSFIVLYVGNGWRVVKTYGGT